MAIKPELHPGIVNLNPTLGRNLRKICRNVATVYLCERRGLILGNVIQVQQKIQKELKLFLERKSITHTNACCTGLGLWRLGQHREIRWSYGVEK